MNGSAAGESAGSTLKGMIPSDRGERQGDCQNGGARNRELHVGRTIVLYDSVSAAGGPGWA